LNAKEASKNADNSRDISKKAALILTAFACVTVANFAHAGGSVIVLSDNGYYAVVHKPELNLEQATALAIGLCQKKGGTNIKVVASSSSMAKPGAYCVVKSGAIVGIGFQCASSTEAYAVAVAACRQKGGANPHVVKAGTEGNALLDTVYPAAYARRL